MATKLPSGNWRVNVLIGRDDKGKRLYKSFIAPTKQEADLLALQWRKEHRSDDKTGKTFAQAAKDFADLNAHTLSPSTLKGYDKMRRMLQNEYLKFYSTPVASIDKNALQAIVNNLAATHAPKTVRNYHAYIGTVLRSAGITPPEVNLPQKKKPQYNIPDEATLTRVFEASKGTEWEVPVLLGAIVPMRRGEICGASLDDLSDDNVLHIHTSAVEDVDGNVVEKTTKTVESDRYVELPAAVADKIREQGYICNIDLTQFSKYFGRFLARNGFKHFRFHDLRHAFVSIAHAAGIPDAYIMARGGWSTNYTVNNVYRHVLDSDRKKAEKTVNDTFTGLLP